MKICLAGFDPNIVEDTVDSSICKYALQSFYYAKDPIMEMMVKKDFLMVDSGAFTFIQQHKKRKGGVVDFDEYTNKYIDFINKWDIKYPIEMDIDVVVGLDEVERLRKKIEDGTHRQVIPVWHTNRGTEYFEKMCQEYRYVAVGGFVSREFTKDGNSSLDWFVDTAHKYGSQIHILGVTDVRKICKHRFDSVDSTRWVSGGRFGDIFYFDGNEIKKINRDDVKFKDDYYYKKINSFNFIEWCKFQKYADIHY